MRTRPITRPRPSGRQRRRTTTLLLVGITGTLLSACGDDDSGVATDATAATRDDTATSTTSASEPEAPAVPVTEVAVTAGGTAGEFGYATDLTTIETGRVRVELTNDGALEHQAMLLRMDDGIDFGALAAAGANGPAAFLDLVDGYGGPNAAAPGGGTSSSTQDLEPGNYLLACLIPDAAGTPHIVQGMFSPFTVVEPAAPGDPVAEADAAVDADGEASLLDFAFVTDGDIEAGSTFAVTNDGDQAHELVAYRMDADATIGDVTAALADPASGPPPIAQGGAGLGLLRPGGTATLTLPTEPGRYALLCFLPDVAGDGAPHFTKGMAAEVELG